MLNILSYVGMNMQSEVCLWCLLGLVRTIFDATLFKVNANLKQVWQMNMPAELSKPVQRALRTMVSGVMLVQCFTVYVYLAAYIVLLYPVFLEERPALVLPWLLLAAIRKLLCELTSLALGLGTCLLLGPARAPCIKFVVVKFALIMPAFYMWMLVFSYYHALKMATAFKTFPAVLPPNDNDYGLELAVRRRRTKSLLGEEQLRKKLVANFYGERTPSAADKTYLHPALQTSSRIVISSDASFEEEGPESEADVMKPSTAGLSDIGAYAYEDWFGSEVMIPRDTDRILEQIVLMLLRIGAYLKKEGKESITASQILNSAIPVSRPQQHNIDCAAINGDDTETPPYIGSSKGNIASYLREYPQIFMKKQGNGLSQTELTFATLKTGQSHVETDEDTTSKNKVKQNSPSNTSCEEISLVGVEKVPSKKKITISDSNTTSEDNTVAYHTGTLPLELQTKRTTKPEEKKTKSKVKKQRASEFEKYAIEEINKVLDALQESDITASHYKKTSAESKHSNNNKNTETMENDNLKKITHFAIPDAGNRKKNTENQTPKENNNDETIFGRTETVEESLIQIKRLNTDNSKKASDITILNETGKEVSALSLILDVENNEQFVPSGIESVFKSNDNKITIKASDETLLIENNNRESTHSLIFNVGNNEKFSYDSKISKAGTSHEIPKVDNSKDFSYTQILNDIKIKELTDVKISKEDSNSNLNNTNKEINNDLLNLSNNKESSQKNTEKTKLTESQISKNDKNKEIPLRILSNDDNITDSLDVKVSNKDSTDVKISHEVKNKGSTDDKIPNKKNSKVPPVECHCRKYL